MYVCPRNGELVDCKVCDHRVVPHRVESLYKGTCATHEIKLVRSHK